MKLITPLIEHIRHIMALSREEASLGQRALQFTVRLVRHCGLQLWHDNAPQHAAALTYRTIFGLVPFFVLALLVFRAFGGFEDLGEQISDWLLRYTGIPETTVVETPHTPDTPTAADPQTTATPDQGAAPQAVAPDGEQTLPTLQTEDQGQNLRQIITDLEERVSEVSFTTIGVVGLVLLIWAAIGLAAAVEDSFNYVYRATRGRTWTMRVVIYWTTITLGPVLIGLSLWLTGQVVGWVDEMGTYLPAWVHWALDSSSRAAALLATWVLLTLLYVLMPNTTVKLRPALIGALVAAILWEIAKWGFQLYFAYTMNTEGGESRGYSALYGTLGLIPLFLFWVYITWLIILFGLELTYTLQMLPNQDDQGGEFENKPRTPDVLLDARWLIPMTVAIGEAFQRGEAVTVHDLANRLSLPSGTVDRMAKKLEEHGLVHALDRGVDAPACYALALPPEHIGAARLLELGQALGMDEQAARHAPAYDVVERIGQAEQAAVAKLTLADMLDEKRAPQGAPNAAG